MTRPQVAVVIEETFPDSLYDQATSGCGNRRDLSRLSLTRPQVAVVIGLSRTRPQVAVVIEETFTLSMTWPQVAVVIEETFPDSLYDQATSGCGNRR